MKNETLQKDTAYTLSTFRSNWKKYGFREAWRIDDEMTVLRSTFPTLSEIHSVGKTVSREVGGLYSTMFHNPEATIPEKTAYFLCASVGYPIGYVGGLIFGALGVKAKSLETEVRK